MGCEAAGRGSVSTGAVEQPVGESSRWARSSWGLPLALTFGLRVLYSSAAAIFSTFLPWDPKLVYSNFAEHVMRPDGSARYALLAVWQRFDTVWYLHIATHGYDRPDAVVFYPLYPLLLKALGYVTSPLLAGLAISTAATYFIFWGLKKLLTLDFHESGARRVLLLYAAWPGSFIFFAAYPDSLALALMVWSIYLARKERWKWAGLAGACAALSKAIGGVVLLPLLVLAYRRRKLHPGTLWLLLIPAASAAYQGWLRWTGHPLVSSAYSHYWKTPTVWPWITLWDSVRAIAITHDPGLILNLLILAVIAVLITLPPRRAEYVVYSVALLILFFAKHSEPLLQSSVRYVLAVFPAFIGLAAFLQRSRLASRFPLLLTALFILNLTGLYLFLKWSLVF
jgi:hypothetical protein